MEPSVTARGPFLCPKFESTTILPTIFIIFIYLFFFSFLSFERERLNGMLSCCLVVCFVRIETSALGVISLLPLCTAAPPSFSHLEFEWVSVSVVSVALRQNIEFPQLASTMSRRIHSHQWIARVHVESDQPQNKIILFIYLFSSWESKRRGRKISFDRRKTSKVLSFSKVNKGSRRVRLRWTGKKPPERKRGKMMIWFPISIFIFSISSRFFIYFFLSGQKLRHFILSDIESRLILSTLSSSSTSSVDKTVN